MSKPSALTPMMRQYLEIKDRHKDAILFFRLGDFYEMFFEDAIEASRILEITLTTRNKNDKTPVPLCGIPHHSASPYIAKLIENGKKVAICEQVEDPKTARGVVKREVTRIVTPGLVTDEQNLKSRDTNYLAAVTREEMKWGISFLDLSAGDFRVTEIEFKKHGPDNAIMDELMKIAPKELVLPERLRSVMEAEIIPYLGCPVTWLEDAVFDIEDGADDILDFFRIKSLEGLGCSRMSAGLGASGAILNYLKETHSGEAGHIGRLKPYHTSSFMLIDISTKKNLELTSTISEDNRKGSLYHTLDFTQTAMGGRRLKEWFNYPLQDIDEINRRLDAVSNIKDRGPLRGEVRNALDSVYDIERLNGRIALGRATPRDLVALKNSLAKLPLLLELLVDFTAPLITDIADSIDPLTELEELISRAVEEDPPVSIREGGVIRTGYKIELDELKNISREGKGYLARLEAEEKTRTGISSLKVRYNKVFGYYIEISRANLHLVPDEYMRRQTLTNAERFITPELKEYEARILGAQEKILEMEYDIFTAVRGEAAGYSGRLKSTAEALSELDCLASLAEAADRYGYSRPVVDGSKRLLISEGRHPVVERLNPAEPFVPNDTDLDCGGNQMVIITGPNMAGKSTYIRQVALITLLAHMGSFVPARSATIGLVDRIFSRVGASDNLARGQSTFMVEMIETANILNNATEKSLIILDEIGRGTSTFDGVSIAWAVAEYIHDSKGLGARTLFATHYHELTELSLARERISNLNVAVKEWNGSIIFLRKIVEGGASRSYGIEVARLAGLPEEVVNRSLEILANLERGELDDEGMPRLALPKRPASDSHRDRAGQMNLFMSPPNHITDEIRNMDISGMTPLEALNRLSRLKEEIL